MGIQIRPAAVTDVAAIFQVRTSVTENHLSHAELAGRGITEAAVAAMITGGDCTWVAVEGDRVVGFSMIDADEGSLFAAFVLPSYEGQGIGRRIVGVAEAALFARHEVCWLETGRDTRATGFYRRLGWGKPRDIGGGDIRLEKRRP